MDIANSSMYSRFSINGKEISAFVVDRDFQWSEIAALSSQSGRVTQDTDSDVEKSTYNGILPVLDPCGMSLILDQVLIQPFVLLVLPCIGSYN